MILGEERDALDIPWGLVILLENSTREGVDQRNTEEANRYLCKFVIEKQLHII